MLEKIVQTDQYTIVTAIVENGVDCLDTSTGELKLGIMLEPFVGK